jgi:acyl-CoA synthetase (NDP forming)
MVESLRIYPALKGARGQEPADIDAIVDAIQRLSQLLVDFPQVKEIDINPLRVFAAHEGAAALDARVIIET